MTTTDAAGTAVAPAARSRRLGAWYVAEHRLVSARRAWSSNIFPAIGSPVLYLFAMGLGLGSLVSGNLGPRGVDGVGYLVFLAPALLTSAAFQTASEEFIFPIRVGFKWNPIFFGMNAAPLSPGQIIDGNMLFSAGRILVNGLVFFAFTVAFGAVPSAWGILAVPIAALTALAFGGPLCAYIASLEKEASQESLVMRFIVVPLTLFSGTYFPLSVMPVYLQWIGWVSPLWHGTQLARDVAYGMHEPAWLVAGHLAYLLAAFLIGWRLARRIAARKLNR